jgi:hypothetical protein
LFGFARFCSVSPQIKLTLTEHNRAPVIIRARLFGFLFGLFGLVFGLFGLVFGLFGFCSVCVRFVRAN